MSTIVQDIPGTIHEYDHSGAVGNIVPDASATTTEDGDTSYVSYQGGALTGGTAGYQLFVKFPPTPIIGVLTSTALVIQAKGTDSRTGNAPYDAAHGLTSIGPVALIVRRGDDGSFIGPEAEFDNIRGAESTDYVETVTPLQSPPGTEYVDQHMIEIGNVTYNPGTGINILDSFRGDGANPGVPTEIRYSYIALRVTYEVPDPFGGLDNVRRRFFG